MNVNKMANINTQQKYEFLKTAFIGLFGLILIFCHPLGLTAQISEGGLPPSFSYQTILRSAPAPVQVPIDFYVEDLRVTDDWLARDGVPMPVAKLITVDYTMENAGYHSTLPGGERIWRLHLQAKDAIALMLYYEDFYIPEGGKLFIYSADKSQLLGAYTHRTHPSGGLFATEFIGGDEVVLEYVASETSDEKPRICIREIGYGYNTAALRHFCGITTRATSGSCMVNVNCEEGAAWQNEKKSVCYMVQKIGSGKNFICTGSLMNNTAEDFKPFVLTARHCALGENGEIASSADMEQWLFYFHREREECSNSSLSAVSKTMIGCEMLVNTGTEAGSDGMLLLLKQEVPEAYDVFYNGWDHRDNAASSGVSLHHPSGDYMKISTYATTPNNYTFQSTEFTGDRNAHWNVIFKKTANGHGVTEGGSSGSPLYNENKLVVGTLTGGNSSCSAPSGYNIYGKMSYHWNQYEADSSTRLDVWLDPLRKGVNTFQGRFRKVFKPAPTNLDVANLGGSVSLTWKAPARSETPAWYNVYRNNTKIGETVSLSFVDEEPEDGSITYAVSAVYADGEESPFTMATLSYVTYKSPSDLKAEREYLATQVKLSWTLPTYEQTIFWGTLEVAYSVGFEDDTPFYFGQKWLADEIAPFHKKTIKAVQFMPMESHTYEIYISQGARTYAQKIKTSTLKFFEMNTILLDESFVIDGTKSLIVSIYASEVGSGRYYPAVSDDGPAVSGKGNVFSWDGENWQAYNEKDPEKYNYNFIMTAIVTSESGTLPAENTSGRNVSARSLEIQSLRHDIHSRAAAISPVNQEIVQRNSVPAAFPEITKFRIYRSSSVYKDVDGSTTMYLDNTPLNSHNYEVSAFYGAIESEKSNKASISIVGNDDLTHSIYLYPTRFSDFVSLEGHTFVSRVEIISVSGKCCMTLDYPGQTIQTSSLSPGLYFFRIYGKDNSQTVIKAIKSK